MIRQIALLLVLIAAVWFHGNYHGKNTERLAWQTTTNDAVKQARKTEREQQEKVNAAIQKQFDDLASVHGQLIIDLDRLRNRPGRASLPTTARTECKGSTGAELSRQDAEFLTRLAARADEIRIALIACYDYADSVN